MRRQLGRGHLARGSDRHTAPLCLFFSLPSLTTLSTHKLCLLLVCCLFHSARKSVTLAWVATGVANSSNGVCVVDISLLALGNVGINQRNTPWRST